ncbi:unnamed protein product [Pieris brassicae]|uniref:Cuticle protein n=1 Tax=Pieris brassicae TaxID=7116 RepID=A0A9P0X845_PIEBR|nr:unnamed protein product [Pieris brassicae]
MKIILAAVMICSVSAGLLAPGPYAYPGLAHVGAPIAPVAIARPALAVARPAYAAAAVDDYDPNPQYSYAYDIQDALTDAKIVLCLCVLRAAAIIVTDAPPSTEYNYWYDIADPTTGDAQFHKEIKQGNFIRGSYYIIDPDGSKRTVVSKNGFKALIRTVLVHSQYNSPKSYSPVNSAYRMPLPEFRQPPATNTNLIQDEPVLFTPGNDTQINRPTFSQGELFMPNYMHH